MVRVSERTGALVTLSSDCLSWDESFLAFLPSVSLGSASRCREQRVGLASVGGCPPGGAGLPHSVSQKEN